MQIYRNIFIQCSPYCLSSVSQRDLLYVLRILCTRLHVQNPAKLLQLTTIFKKKITIKRIGREIFMRTIKFKRKKHTSILLLLTQITPD